MTASSICKPARPRFGISKSSGWTRCANFAGGRVTIAAGDVQLAETMREDDLQESAARQQLIVKQLTPKFTGNLDEDFKGATLFRYQKQPDAAVRSVAAWDAENLYLGWEVKDATPWVNGAADAEMLYLGGDTVDFQLGVDPQADKDRGEAVLGDLRLSIGNFQGTPQAVIYRRLAKDKHPRTFSSGVVKQYPMESVELAGDVKLVVKVVDKQYVVEAAVPLVRLDLKPADGLRCGAISASPMAIRLANAPGCGHIGPTSTPASSTMPCSSCKWSPRTGVSCCSNSSKRLKKRTGCAAS